MKDVHAAIALYERRLADGEITFDGEFADDPQCETTRSWLGGHLADHLPLADITPKSS